MLTYEIATIFARQEPWIEDCITQLPIYHNTSFMKTVKDNRGTKKRFFILLERRWNEARRYLNLLNNDIKFKSDNQSYRNKREEIQVRQNSYFESKLQILEIWN
jgi:hypothetical protein